MFDLADRLNSWAECGNAGFSLVLSNGASLLLRDGAYSSTSLTALIRAWLVHELLGEACQLSGIVHDVVDEVNKIAQRGSVSHLVIYGTNRIQVLASILRSDRLSAKIPLILSEKEIEKERLIADRIDNQLTLEEIKRLPDVLDFPADVAFTTEPGVLEKLYISGRLLQPYQIDTDRFPFSGRYF